MAEKLTKAPSVSADEVLGRSKVDRRRRLIGAICAPICALLIYFTPIEALTPEAHKLLSIMTLVCLWGLRSLCPYPSPRS